MNHPASWLTSRTREWAFVFLLGSILSAETSPSAVYPFLVRLEHSNRESHACSLVKTSGDFHLEVDSGEQTRVFEGQLSQTQLLSLEHALDDRTLQNLSQQRIEEPLISNGRDTLQINIFRKDHWQDLLFETAESQAPFQHALEPLLRWLTNFGKLPHRELSEDAGKNNCLPPKKLVLKRRTPSLPESPPTSDGYSAAPILVPPATGVNRAPPALLFGMFSFRMSGTGAHQSCMLVADDGQYRFEDRVQPGGSKVVHNEVFLGRMSDEEIGQLRRILDSPSLAEIHHHEPPGGLVVRMMGDVLRLSIRRPSGVQEIVLSSNQRTSGYFYSGDGDLSLARDLLKFLGEHVENNQTPSFPASLRNDCKALP